MLADAAYTATEHLLLERIVRDEVAVNDLMSLAMGLRNDLESLSGAERNAVFERLNTAAAHFRSSRKWAEATLVEMAVRHLRRAFH